MRSLQLRLGSGLAISLVVLLGLQWALASRAIHYLLEDYILEELEQDAEAVLNACMFTAEGRLQVDVSRLHSVYQRPFSGHYFEVAYEQQIFRSRSLWDESLAGNLLTPGQRTYGYENGPAGQPLLVVRRGYRKQDRPLTVMVADDLTALQRDASRFQWRYGVVSVIVMVLLVLLQVWVVRRSLRPVEHARRQLQALERGEIPALSGSVPQEIAPLIHEINRLVNAMQQRVQRSRKSLGNLAHALKTPLSILQHLVDDALQSGDRPRAQAMADNINKIRQLTERELKRARLAGGNLYVKHYQLREELTALLATLQAIYRQKSLDVELEVAADILVNMDREDLLELMGNLLDNAYKWATSRIRVQVRRAGELHIAIEDDGPGCSAEEFQLLAQRGVRLDEQTAGHGLGLGIVNDVVQSYGGRLEFSNSARLGGLRIDMELPI